MAKLENMDKSKNAGPVGIFGGTFDPVHLGHLLLAELAGEKLGLQRVVWIPAATAPHVDPKHASDPSHRLEMVRLATSGNSSFTVDDRELRRGGNSYSVDTLNELHQKFPSTEWVFLMGADSLAAFHTWYQPQRICQLARVVVIGRGGQVPPDLGLLAKFLPHSASPSQLAAEHFVATPQIEISSTDIRRRVAEGLTIRYLVPAAVEAYIAANGLYK